MKVLPLTLAVPWLVVRGRRRRRRAELPVKVLPTTLAVPPPLARPPPKVVAELPVKVLPLTLAVPSLSEAAADVRAELLVKVLPLTLAVPLVEEAAAVELAELLVKVLPTTLAAAARWRGRRRAGGGVAGEGAAAHARRVADVVEQAAAVGRRRSCR